MAHFFQKLEKFKKFKKFKKVSLAQLPAEFFFPQFFFQVFTQNLKLKTQNCSAFSFSFIF